jgi:hypothetical protein
VHPCIAGEPELITLDMTITYIHSQNPLKNRTSPVDVASKDRILPECSPHLLSPSPPSTTPRIAPSWTPSSASGPISTPWPKRLAAPSPSWSPGSPPPKSPPTSAPTSTWPTSPTTSASVPVPTPPWTPSNPPSPPPPTPSNAAVSPRPSSRPTPLPPLAGPEPKTYHPRRKTPIHRRPRPRIPPGGRDKGWVPLRPRQSITARSNSRVPTSLPLPPQRTKIPPKGRDNVWVRFRPRPTQAGLSPAAPKVPLVSTG